MSYWKWNKALGEFFFRNSRPGQRILLYLDRDLVDQIGRKHGLGEWNSFCQAVKVGPIKVPYPHYLPQMVQSWKGPEEEGAPYFLNGIAILILAWTERPTPDMGYYQALDCFCKEELGMEVDSNEIVRLLVDAFESIRYWSEAWEDVPGTFADEPIQNYRYVGRIKHHALVAPAERSNLHYLLRKQDLDPGSTPDTEWLVHTLKGASSSESLIPEIISLLNHRKEVVQRSIREWLLEELRNWHGEAPDTPITFAKPWKDQFELRFSFDRRMGWGLRLFHPEWAGQVEFSWKGKKPQTVIGSGKWSDRLMVDGGELQLDFSKQIQPVSIELLTPVKRVLKAPLCRYFYPADTFGAFGADYIGTSKVIRNRPFYHFFPEEEMEEVSEWAKKKAVINWRARDTNVPIPENWKVYFGDSIARQGSTSVKRPLEEKEPKPISKRPIFPLRSSNYPEPWIFDELGQPNGSSQVQISHYQISCEQDSLKPMSERVIFQPGSADEPPIGWDLLIPLLRKGKTIIPFSDYYDCLERKAEELDEFVDKFELRIRRKESASLGYFFENLKEQKLQLAPPSLTLLPDNFYQIRATMTGIWTPNLVDIVYQWCSNPERGIVLKWLQQPSPFLPPTGQLVFNQLNRLHSLIDHLNEQLPGVVGYWGPYSYPQVLLESLARPNHLGWFAQENGLRKQGYSALNFALSTKSYQFEPPSPIPRFPTLNKIFNDRYGYAMYTWWENEDHGFECAGEWAVWELVHQHGAPVLFHVEGQPHQVCLPRSLPIPPMLERALTMASGELPVIKKYQTPSGQMITMRCFPEVRFPMRKLLPALLLGADPDQSFKSFFHPVSSSLQPQILEKWTN